MHQYHRRPLCRKPSGVPGQQPLLPLIAKAKSEEMQLTKEAQEAGAQVGEVKKEAMAVTQEMKPKKQDVWWAETPPKRTADSWGDGSSYTTRDEDGDYLVCQFASGRRGCHVYRCRHEPTRNDYVEAIGSFRAEMKRWRTEQEMAQRGK